MLAEQQKSRDALQLEKSQICNRLEETLNNLSQIKSQSEAEKQALLAQIKVEKAKNRQSSEAQSEQQLKESELLQSKLEMEAKFEQQKLELIKVQQDLEASKNMQSQSQQDQQSKLQQIEAEKMR